MSKKAKNYLSMYVATSRGEIDPCGPGDIIKMKSLDEAIALVKDVQLDEIYEDLSNELDDLNELEDNFEIASEFYQQTGVLPGGEIGWVECGEEGLNLIVQEGNEWYDKLEQVDDWSKKTWKEFKELITSEAFC